jgi:hypothetical protein
MKGTYTTSVKRPGTGAKRLLLCAGICAALLLSAESSRAAMGLTSKFVDVVIENMKPGHSYNLRELKGVPYEVKNKGDAPVNVVIEIVPPEKKQLQDSYEPIPDPSWIKATPDKHGMAAGSNAFSDLIISVPDDPALAGRHFQAMIWSHTVGTGFLGVGVKTRLRFSIGAGPESLAAEKKRKAMVTLNFDIWPETMYVTGAATGKKYDIKKKEGKSFKIANRADEAMELELKSTPWDPRFTLPEGYEAAPDPQWLVLKPAKLKLDPNSITEVKIFTQIPEEHKGKKFAFVVSSNLPDAMTLTASNRVLVTVADGK